MVAAVLDSYNLCTSCNSFSASKRPSSLSKNLLCCWDLGINVKQLLAFSFAQSQELHAVLWADKCLQDSGDSREGAYAEDNFKTRQLP